MADLTTLQNVALIVGPVAAAAAAIAAWFAAFQSSRMARAVALPDLAIQVTKGGSGVMPTYGAYTLGATIHNAGGGPAQGVSYVIVCGQSAAYDTARHGFLRSDQIIKVATDIEVDPKSDGRDVTYAMVSCRDRFGYPHSWTNRGDYKIWKNWRRKPKYGDVLERFKEFFPEAMRGREWASVA